MKIIKQKSLNCPNCGAEISHVYNHKCEYCGGMLDFNEPEEKTIQLKPEDLVEITLRDVMFEPVSNRIILLFSGYKLEQPKVYEYDGNKNNNMYVSRIEEYINPPKCSFCIELDRYDLEKYGMGYVRSAICNSGIRYNEIDKVMAQALDNEEIRFFGGYR